LSAVALAPGSGHAAQTPSQTVRIGVIGTGGRARRLMAGLDRVPGTRIAGLADLWDAALAQAAKLAPPGVYTTHQYQELLARKDIDAVIIGSPNHWHAQMTIDACAAGKDVYVEKPVTHTIAQGPKVIEAQNRYKRIVQVGTQQRSMPHLIKAREILKSGQLGTIHKIHMTWNRNMPRRLSAPPDVASRDVSWRDFVGPSATRQEFDAYRFRNWRWFWDFGDGIFGDLMVHWLDTVNWMLDLPMPAARARRAITHDAWTSRIAETISGTVGCRVPFMNCRLEWESHSVFPPGGWTKRSAAGAPVSFRRSALVFLLASWSRPTV
ncbi:MAG: Gfo/Idh/MocA family oxidoreductase, partial [Acidobacteria bacterium]|nr:Gfo/Idh/MocA family oxidoreductase [Acidobacteriota bacterium]